MYVVGVLLMFFMAAGLGAMAAVGVGWQFGQAGLGGGEPGHAGPATPERSKLETTGGSAEGFGATAVESPNEKEYEVSFVHRANDDNSRGDYTYIDHPSIDGDADAVVLVSLGTDLGDAGDASYEHNIGVWYTPVAHKWAIFNQDRAAVPQGSNFEVVLPPDSTEFVHRADLSNTAGHYTYLDDPRTNGEPGAVLSVTQNWNPGGGRGIYNNHPVDTQYDAKVRKWAVYNQDGAPMPTGAAFNIAVSAGADKSAR